MSVSGFAIFCDDIRFENNGKAILIGVYSEDLVPGVLPQVIPLSFWVRLTGVPLGDIKLNLTVGANGKAAHHAEIGMNIHHDDRPVNLYFSGMPISIESDGEIFLELSGFEGNFTFREVLKVMLPGEGNTAASGV